MATSSDAPSSAYFYNDAQKHHEHGWIEGCASYNRDRTTDELLPCDCGVDEFAKLWRDRIAALEAEIHEFNATPFADRVRENVALRENNAALEAERDRLRARLVEIGTLAAEVAFPSDHWSSEYFHTEKWAEEGGEG